MSIVFDVNQELSASARAVVAALDLAERPLMARELTEETTLSRGAVNKALYVLKRNGHVESRVNPLDPRADVYELAG